MARIHTCDPLSAHLAPTSLVKETGEHISSATSHLQTILVLEDRHLLVHSRDDCKNSLLVGFSLWNLLWCMLDPTSHVKLHTHLSHCIFQLVSCCVQLLYLRLSSLCMFGIACQIFFLESFPSKDLSIYPKGRLCL